MERHVYQWTGGRTKTGCLGIRVVYPNGATCLPVNWRKNKHWLSRNHDSVSVWSDMSTSELEEEQTLVDSESGECIRMERHVYQWTGGRTNTGCLGIRVVYPNGATCLPVNWRKNKHWLSRNQGSVSEWSDMSTSELEEEQTLVV